MYAFRYAFLAIIWAAVILLVSAASGSAVSKAGGGEFSAVFWHFGAFVIFGYLLSLAFADLNEGGNASPQISGMAGIIGENPLFIAFFYSVFTEILQIYVPGRYFSYFDIATNGAGSVFGAAANRIFLQYFSLSAADFQKSQNGSSQI